MVRSWAGDGFDDDAVVVKSAKEREDGIREDRADVRRWIIFIV